MNDSDTNEIKQAQIEVALQPSFYGTIAIEVKVQDGTIQTIRRRMEKVET